MKKIFLFFVVALLVGCTDYTDDFNAINERLDKIEQAVPSIGEQIESINTTLGNLDAMDKELKGYIDNLTTTASSLQEQINATNVKIEEVKTALQSEISAAKSEVLAQLAIAKTELENELAQINSTIETLKAKDTELDNKIAELRSYVDTELGDTTDWVNATFATLEQYNALVSEVATIKEQIKAINQSITELETRLTTKINEDIANAVSTLNADIQQKVKDITDAYTNAIKSAKEEITTAYTSAIQNAINALDVSLKAWVGEQLANYYTIAEVEAKITALQTAITDGDATLQEELSKLKSQLETTATEITAAYKKAIEEAINTNNGVIDTKIANEIASVNQRITNEVTTINAKIAEIESRLDNVEAKIAELLVRIQSVTYLPEYSDGIATINHIGNFSEVSLDFKISPKECATELANVWQTSVSCEALYTKTRAASLVTMPAIAFKVDAERGVITVIASGENLSEEFFAGSQEAKIALVISDGNNSITSDYITMVAKEITDEIWYTSTDENIVEPNTVEGWGAKIVSNTYNDGIGIIKFDNPVSIIPYRAFYNKLSLKTIILPQKVQNIEDVAFTFCGKLEYFYGKFSSNDNRCLIVDGELKSLSPQISGEYTLPNTVNRLGHICIASLQNICQIVIPGSVTSFDDNCSMTSTTKVAAFKGAYATTDGRSLIKDNILHGVALYNIKTYDVPEGVTEIKGSIFQNAPLISVTIPATTSRLGSHLFVNCNKLSNVYCKAEVPPTVGGNIFHEVTTIPNIYVPRESVEAYKAAIGWKQWADNIVGFDF